MSKNNNNYNRGNKDTFVKPGDESIVSGKSFFLSFGKTKKGPANPLIESEKNKAENKNAVKGAQTGNNNGKKAPDKNTERGANQDKNHGAGSGNNSRNFHKNNKKNNNFQNKNSREDNVRSKEVQKVQPLNTPAENSANKASEKGSNSNNRNNKKKNTRFDRRGDRRHNNNQAQNTTPVEKNATPAPEKNQDKDLSQNPQRIDKNDRNAKRQKHKKEKFVPTAPEREKEEALLQPIVDRTEIISGTRGNLFGSARNTFSAFSSRKIEAETGDEPRYVDRNIPLAKQIAEQSKPKTYKRELPEGAESVEVIGVRFREAGKVYYFDPGEKKVEKDTPVIVETSRGVEYGFCAIANRRISTEEVVAPLKPIIRIATAEDTERYNSNKELEVSAAKVFKEKVKQLGLEMSLVYVEYTFDNGKLLFYFTADGRVDFRELIKELASAFRTRIELRQIGVRDEAKIVGGLGICGRPVCCKSFLGEFSQVSIKMAKDQNLFINSSKISGTCGRFMCCIRYEDEVYQKEYEKTPKVDAIVETPEGRGIVTESNALKGMVKVLLDDKPEATPAPFKCTEVKLLGYAKKENDNEVPEGVEIPEGE